MKNLTLGSILLLALMLVQPARAAGYKETIEVFRNAGESAAFFQNSYAYAVFPKVATGAVGIGGAYGHGRVYLHDKYIGNATLGSVSIGIQLGGKSFSQIIFFEDAHALEQFQNGKFEFGAESSATAIAASANAQIATNGVGSGRSQGVNAANTQGSYQTGMAVFIVARFGLMASASLSGQKYSYESLEAVAAE
jgi:lipid-binding SYLF domain-containing protein